jgi:hypothetical protein
MSDLAVDPEDFELEVLSAEPINDFSTLVLATDGELFLVLADDEGGESLFPLGHGAKILKAYQEAISQLLKQIN